MSTLAEEGPEALAEHLTASGSRRGWLACDGRDGLRASETLRGLGLDEHLLAGPDWAAHEAVFLEAGEETGCLLGAFLHATRRGQAQGGLRYWQYPTLAAYLRDGLRLAQAMGRKSALAGLWWGGGKGVIARRADRDDDPGHRRAVFADYGRFISSLHGCYVTAEDAGTTPTDMAELQHHTRFVTCIPRERGGSGDPSEWTAAGVVAAIETALPIPLEGATVAMQGAGHVGAAMVPMLLERGVQKIWVAETSRVRGTELEERFGDPALCVRVVAPEDVSILAEACDVLVPNALGGVLNPKTIPSVRARLVCGAANNPLEDDERDAAALAERGVVYVPDFVANRMGIVGCANEHAGTLPDDPEILRHLDPRWEGSVQAVTRRVLEHATKRRITSVRAANQIADDQAKLWHPIWRDRTQQIIQSLVAGGWAG